MARRIFSGELALPESVTQPSVVLTEMATAERLRVRHKFCLDGRGDAGVGSRVGYGLPHGLALAADHFAGFREFVLNVVRRQTQFVHFISRGGLGLFCVGGDAIARVVQRRLIARPVKIPDDSHQDRGSDYKTNNKSSHICASLLV